MATHDNITFNGAPLQEYVEQVVRDEIQEAQTAEIRDKRWRRHIVSKPLNQSRTRHGVAVTVYAPPPAVMEPERKVIIKRQVFLYWTKAPFPESGVSLLGALEYDEVNDTVRCHECGDWHVKLGVHIRSAHKMGSGEYRKKHGLAFRTPLSGVKSTAAFSAMRKQNIKNGIGDNRKHLRRPTVHRPKKITAETHNITGNCSAQIPLKLRQMAERLGRVPTIPEVIEAGIKIDAMMYHWRSYKAAIQAAGLTYRGKGHAVRHGTFIPDDDIKQRLRAFYSSYSRVPYVKEYGKEYLPSAGTLMRRFGSIRNALEGAGLGAFIRPRGRENRTALVQTHEALPAQV